MAWIVHTSGGLATYQRAAKPETALADHLGIDGVVTCACAPACEGVPGHIPQVYNHRATQGGPIVATAYRWEWPGMVGLGEAQAALLTAATLGWPGWGPLTPEGQKARRILAGNIKPTMTALAVARLRAFEATSGRTPITDALAMALGFTQAEILKAGQHAANF